MYRITIADLAREAGVWRKTVSGVLIDKMEISASTRESVMRVIERLGYGPSGVARSLATSRTLTVGLVVPDIFNPFSPREPFRPATVTSRVPVLPTRKVVTRPRSHCFRSVLRSTGSSATTTSSPSGSS